MRLKDCIHDLNQVGKSMGRHVINCTSVREKNEKSADDTDRQLHVQVKDRVERLSQISNSMGGRVIVGAFVEERSDDTSNGPKKKSHQIGFHPSASDERAHLTIYSATEVTLADGTMKDGTVAHVYADGTATEFKGPRGKSEELKFPEGVKDAAKIKDEDGRETWDNFALGSSLEWLKVDGKVPGMDAISFLQTLTKGHPAMLKKARRELKDRLSQNGVGSGD